jgi:hypothetical protein
MKVEINYERTEPWTHAWWHMEVEAGRFKYLAVATNFARCFYWLLRGLWRTRKQ